MNKKGNIVAIIWMVGILFVILIGALFLAFGGMVVDWTFDEVLPEISSIGMVGSSNVSEYSEYTINPVNTVVQSFTWLGGLIYIFGLIGCLGLAFAFRFTGNKWLMGLFIACIFMLVLASIFISNIYQDFYDGNDDVSDRLHEQTMLSWLILYSPLVMCVIAFLCGVIMFTGEGGEEQL